MHPIFMSCITHWDRICFPFAVGLQKTDSLRLFSGPFQWQRSWWRHWCQKEEKEAEKEEENWCHRSSPGPSCQGAQSMNYIRLFIYFYTFAERFNVLQVFVCFFKNMFHPSLHWSSLSREFRKSQYPVEAFSLAKPLFPFIPFPNRWTRCPLISFRRSRRPSSCSLSVKALPKPWRRQLEGVTSSGTRSLCPN